jgi:hypothetical protein
LSISLLMMLLLFPFLLFVAIVADVDVAGVLQETTSMSYPEVHELPLPSSVHSRSLGHSGSPHPYQALILFSSSSRYTNLAIAVAVVLRVPLIAARRSTLPCA